MGAVGAPFHNGERALQRRAGVRERRAEVAAHASAQRLLKRAVTETLRLPRGLPPLWPGHAD